VHHFTQKGGMELDEISFWLFDIKKYIVNPSATPLVTISIRNLTVNPNTTLNNRAKPSKNQKYT
jgi:hypothetical protein